LIGRLLSTKGEKVKLSFKQALALVDILKASLATQGSVGGYPLHIRKMLVHQIINQQSSELFDLKPGDELEWDWKDLQDAEPQDLTDL
jgi:hypothetical protein